MPTYTWAEIAEENRTCPHHGQDYLSVHWELTGSKAPEHLRKYWTNCPVCNSVWKQEAEEFERESQGGAIYSLRKRQGTTLSASDVALAAAGVPERFLKATIQNWSHGMDKQKRIWRWAVDYTEAYDVSKRYGTTDAMIGTPGTGKTHLAIGILAHVITKKFTGRYTTVMNMLGRIKATFGDKSAETEQSVINELTTLDLLVIDEVGKNLDTGYETSQLFRILDNRYGNMLPTILISNLPLSDFKAFAGDALIDRMRENTGKILPFDWGSYRSSKRR